MGSTWSNCLLDVKTFGRQTLMCLSVSWEVSSTSN
ncbi:rCG43290 [Rattus norvegicus]|uniref:RCG43290 n=1 Tax=Rattus norvegicus TaxID=10116 RepID=A6IWB9_RAT|nr:rCG43290 [Rattus norvegicus]